MELPTFPYPPTEGLETAYRSGVPVCTPRTRRLAPVLQFVTPVDPYAERLLRSVAASGHAEGRSLEEVCYALHVRAAALGYGATLAVQEVSSRAMPSYPGQTVVTPLLLLDLQPVGH